MQITGNEGWLTALIIKGGRRAEIDKEKKKYKCYSIFYY
jgi:hypothetical protein